MDPETYGHRRLACAIVARAALDAKSSNPALAHPARAWLVEDGMDLAEAVGLDPDRVMAWVDGLGPMQQAVLL